MQTLTLGGTEITHVISITLTCRIADRQLDRGLCKDTRRILRVLYYGGGEKYGQEKEWEYQLLAQPATNHTSPPPPKSGLFKSWFKTLLILCGLRTCDGHPAGVEPGSHFNVFYRVLIVFFFFRKTCVTNIYYYNMLFKWPRNLGYMNYHTVLSRGIYWNQRSYVQNETIIYCGYNRT